MDLPANLVMMLVWYGLAIFARSLPGTAAALLLYLGWAGIMTVAAIMLINLVPIPPLDGSRIVASVLTACAASLYLCVEYFDPALLAGLLVSGILSSVLAPISAWIQKLSPWVLFKPLSCSEHKSGWPLRP